MNRMMKSLFWAGVCLCFSLDAQAGVPECNDLRLEDVGNCEVRGSLECEAGCDELGVYKKACATRLRTVCSTECTLDADATCTDGCTETCTQSCDRGENVICIHNCFSECSGSCEGDCADASDPAQCEATCEANCDGECDITCKPLVDGDCYKHCVECCGGSCTAQANMDCQQTCQEEQFEDCEYEFRADCDASCSGEGALFCDGEFALAGRDIPACVAALAALELGNLDVKVEAESAGEAKLDASGCSFDPGSHPDNRALGFFALIMLGLGFSRGRRGFRADGSTRTSDSEGVGR